MASITGCAPTKRDHAEEGQEEVDIIKKQKLEDGGKPVSRDPGKKDYGEMRKILRQLTDVSSKSECDQNVLERIRIDVENLAKMVAFKTAVGETLNSHKLLQMNLKCTLFNSKDDVHNIKNFLTCLEDSSASKSNRDNSIYMFLASKATELWYQWSEDLCQWQWTPEADGCLWMPCTTNVVSDGNWKGEVPALENIEIINYLNTIRPLPSDEQYLSSSYDVIQLLCKLKDMEDEQITGAVKKIATEVVALEGNSDVPTDVKVVKELMDKFRALLDQSSGNGKRKEEKNGEKEDNGERGEDDGERGEEDGERGEEDGERGEEDGERGEDNGERGEEDGERGEDNGERGEEDGERGEEDGESGED